MTSEDLSKLITDMALKNFDANKDALMNSIMKCVHQEAERGEINIYSLFPKLLILVSKITIQISTGTTFSVLNALGMFRPENFEKVHPERPDLKLVWDSSKHQHEDNQ